MDGGTITSRRATVWVLMLTAAVPLVLGQGCPPQIPQNNAPVANAGTDQSVAGGATVNLNGSASSDPDGDAVTFAWSQTFGTAVILSNTASASPSFVAPNTTETLTFQLTVTDPSNASSSDSVNVSVTTNGAPQPPPTTPALFIANFTGNNIVGYDITSPQSVNGNIAPDANLAGAQTQLTSPSDIVVDAGGALLVSNFNTPSITGYDNANDLTGINGNVAPQRNVQGAATLLAQPTTLAVSTANDLLFVANILTDQITVFANASTNALNGNLAPTRTITSANLNNPFGINFGANDELYVANNALRARSIIT